MPDELRQQIIDAAEKNLRSINSEIIARLEESFSFDLPGWGAKTPGETPNQRVELALEAKFPENFDPKLHWEFEKKQGELIQDFRERSKALAAGQPDPGEKVIEEKLARQFVTKNDFDELRSEISSVLAELKSSGLIGRPQKASKK